MSYVKGMFIVMSTGLEIESFVIRSVPSPVLVKADAVKTLRGRERGER